MPPSFSVGSPPPLSARSSPPVADRPAPLIYSHGFHFTAVHPQCGPRHPACAGRHEKRHEFRDFFRLAIAAYTGFFREVLGSFYHRHVVQRRPVFKIGPAPSCHYRPGQYAIYLNAIGDSAIRKRLGQSHDRRVDRAYLRLHREPWETMPSCPTSIPPHPLPFLVRATLR
jgi:hypothetical protein